MIVQRSFLAERSNFELGDRIRCREKDFSFNFDDELQLSLFQPKDLVERFTLGRSWVTSCRSHQSERLFTDFLSSSVLLEVKTWMVI